MDAAPPPGKNFSQKNADQRMTLNLENNATDDARRQYVQFNFLMFIELGEKQIHSDNHEKRLSNIRKELVHLKNTDWQYDSIEKHIGQA